MVSSQLVIWRRWALRCPGCGLCAAHAVALPSSGAVGCVRVFCGGAVGCGFSWCAWCRVGCALPVRLFAALATLGGPGAAQVREEVAA